MSALLLDTTVLIDTLRRRPAAQRVLGLRARGDEPWTCAVNVEEVVRGLRPSEREAALPLFDGVRLVPLGRTEGARAGAWRWEHAERGITLHQADCLIAAAALAVGGRLATGNPKHFPMAELAVEHWPVGA